MTNNLTNKSAHTPGPWTADCGRRESYTVRAGRLGIAQVFGYGTPAAANARLLAAAPAMYEALAKAVAWADRHGKEPDWLDEARTALTPSPPPTQENAG
jgi:hypothetical protein